MNDFPKIQSPFVRKEIDGQYVVTPEIAEGMEWVFTDPNVLAVEKLDGTNVSIVMESGNMIGLYNRTQVKPIGALEDHRFIQGIRTTNSKGRLPVVSGQHFGELMGPKIQSNFLKLDQPEWFPFEHLKRSATYTSFHKYEKNFDNWSSWFQNDLFSLLYVKLHGEKIQPEGIVFHHPDGRMAKLRVDMWPWFTGRRHNR